MSQEYARTQTLAVGAKDLLQDPAFLEAIVRLRKAYFNELMMVSTGRRRQKELRATIMALEAVPQQLQLIVNDYTMARSKPHAA